MITVTSILLALLVYLCALGSGCFLQTRFKLGFGLTAIGVSAPVKSLYVSAVPASVPVAVVYNPDRAMIEAALKGRDPFTKFEPGTRGVLTARTTTIVHDARNLPLDAHAFNFDSDYVVNFMTMEGTKMVH
ncbi:hypothetical protein D9758_011220 [Tetrapyrgos nigripes]|uniref:Uncharacterized protein n=1 Tax=Tetrapyrgos nigripes TaxID=182062 RepID=A0A8H5D6R6_9AGAR|nr:hypothetical protein D9758_011220 [Tetrapyrgos nigripes]